MPVPVITKGATTDHGGEISECEPSFTVHGKGVHLEGMQHYCPDCDETVSAVASNHTKTVFGKAMILEGDVATCGAKFISAQNVASVGGGGAVGSASYSSLNSNSNEPLEYNGRMQLVDEITKQPLVGVRYALKYEDKTLESITDKDGYTQIIEADNPATVQIYLLVDDEE